MADDIFSALKCTGIKPEEIRGFYKVSPIVFYLLFTGANEQVKDGLIGMKTFGQGKYSQSQVLMSGS